MMLAKIMSPPKPASPRLEAINRWLAALAGRAEVQVEKALLALSQRNPKLAFEVTAGANQIADLNRAIEADATTLLSGILEPAQVRSCVAAVKAAGLLMRISEQAVEIARDLQSAPALPPGPVSVLVRLGSLSRQTLGEAIDAFVRNEPDKAIAAARHNGEADALYASLVKDLLGYVAADPSHAESGMRLLFIARSLERISGHAHEIAESVVAAEPVA